MSFPHGLAQAIAAQDLAMKRLEDKYRDFTLRLAERLFLAAEVLARRAERRRRRMADDERESEHAS